VYIAGEGNVFFLLLSIHNYLSGTTTCLPSSYLSMFGTAQNQQGYEGAGVGPQAHGHKQFLPGMWYI